MENSSHPPAYPVRLIFIHHSVGGNWLADNNGKLGIALSENNYIVSDTNVNWGPNQIGSRTDIGHWWEWFCNPQHSPDVLRALFNENGQNNHSYGTYTRIEDAPPGENEIILFKSCFPNSALRGDPTIIPPQIENNPIRNQKAPVIPPDQKNLDQYLLYQLKFLVKSVLGKNKNIEAYSVANAKGIYIDLLNCFKKYPNKLFIAITAPPLRDPQFAANARAFNKWLVNEWLVNYPLKNVAVFDLFNVLTSNGGSPEINDLNQKTGNHHRWYNNQIEYITDAGSDVLAYPTGDNHPNKAGNQKATVEFVTLLNVFYNRWKNDNKDS